MGEILLYLLGIKFFSSFAFYFTSLLSLSLDDSTDSVVTLSPF